MIRDVSAHVRGSSSVHAHAIKRMCAEAVMKPRPRKLTISAQATVTRSRNRFIGGQG